MTPSTDNTIHIVMAEDDTFIAGMYVRKFEMEGFKMDVVGDGQLLLDYLAANKPDIILLDIMMPNVDGWQALQQIKHNPETRTIPVLMMSNLGSEDDIEHAMHLGAQDYVIKAQVTPTEVSAKIRSMLNVA